MMVHVNTRKADQEGVRDEVHKRMFIAAARGLEALGPDHTADRLEARYTTEFHDISKAALSFPGRLPTSGLDGAWLPQWSELRPHVETAVDRLIALNAASPVVLLVNSDEDSQTPDYDGNATPEGLWCILVGGLMLSRGFTIEGLSTAYFRRKAGAYGHPAPARQMEWLQKLLRGPHPPALRYKRAGHKEIRATKSAKGVRDVFVA